MTQYASKNEDSCDDSAEEDNSYSSEDVQYSELLSNSLLVLVDDNSTIQFINEQIEITEANEINEMYWDDDYWTNNYVYDRAENDVIYSLIDESCEDSHDSVMSTNVKIVGLNNVFRVTGSQTDLMDDFAANSYNRTALLDKIYCQNCETDSNSDIMDEYYG